MGAIVHDKNYVGWVQRSLNRITGAGIRTDGLISNLYRMWIMEFQYGTGCGTRDGSVDKTTQDAIIKNNLSGKTTASQIYIKWVQRALTKLDYINFVVPTGVLGKDTLEAVKDFQASVGHKHVDGVIGPKTELDLINKVPDLVVPGYYPGHSEPPPDPLREREEDTLGNNVDIRGIDQRITNWTDMFMEELRHSPGNIADPVRREVTKCMLKKIQMGSNDYAYLTKSNAFRVAQGYAEAAKTAEEVGIPELPQSKGIDRPISQFTFDARDRLRYKVTKFSNNIPSKALYRHYKAATKELYLEIDKGIKEIKYQIHNSGIKAGSYKKLEDWYDLKMASSRSILSCFPDV